MQTFLIYLSQNNFSVKMAKETINSLESFGIEYELFDGVVGNKGKEVLTSHNVFPSIHAEKGGWTAGTIGCLASHYLLWDKCSKQDEPFLVLEQDAVIVRDPRELLPEIKKICHLDGTNPFDLDDKNHFEYYNSQMEKYTPGVKRYPFNTFYGENKIFPKGCFRGTYGYIIKPEGAKDILEFIKNHGLFPSDACLNHSATYLQRANSTYVRLNSFFSSLEIQSKYSFRKKDYDFSC